MMLSGRRSTLLPCSNRGEDPWGAFMGRIQWPVSGGPHFPTKAAASAADGTSCGRLGALPFSRGVTVVRAEAQDRAGNCPTVCFTIGGGGETGHCVLHNRWWLENRPLCASQSVVVGKQATVCFTISGGGEAGHCVLHNRWWWGNRPLCASQSLVVGRQASWGGEHDRRRSPL